MNKNIKKTVYKILKEDPYAREDDWYLIQQVVVALVPGNSGTAFGTILTEMKYQGISFEAITRARRKIQEQYSELRAKKDIEKARREEEENYIIEYGRR
jgi:hypothetical protein